MTDPELERIRRKKIMELQRKLGESSEEKVEGEEEEKKALEEAQRRAMLRKILTSKARERLARVRLARPQLAQAVENYLLQLAQTGQLREKIDEDQLKRILKQLSDATRKEYRITFKRK
ncbi:DNA-binding protein [Methanopyrus sp.]